MSQHEDEARRQLEEAVERSLSQKRDLARGFARFVIKMGHGALAPSSTPERRVTWQQKGRELYGRELFNEVLREELAKLKGEAGK